VTTPRREPRLPITLQVSYRTQGAFLVAYSVNLSKGGIYIETREPLEVGAAVSLELDVPGAGALKVEGVVAWVRQGSPDGLPEGMGVQFNTLDDRYGDVIDEMVRSFVGLTVLLVAASTDRVQVLARYVRSIIACEFLEATAFDEVKASLAQKPDLVIADLDVSSLVGQNAIAAAKALGEGTPVIILAGDAQLRESGKAAGAVEALATPPSFHQLQAAVIRTLSRPKVVR
jgi:uncharacterized protein (TIGR02266 family)